MDDFKYIEVTIYRDDVDGLVYETRRVVEETYPRRGTFIVAYRRMVNPNGARAPEVKEGIHVQDVKKMTPSTDEKILDEYGVAPEADSSLDEHDELPIPHAIGGVDSDHVGDDDSSMYANDAVVLSLSTSTRVRRV